MDAARSSQPIISAEPKLSIEKFADGPITCLKFSGTIDEGFEGNKIARAIRCETLVLDLGGVKKISSFGIREWIDFVGVAINQAKELLLIECAPKVVDQLNMVANFAGGGRVFSFYVPFRCDYCDSEHRVLLEMARDFEAIKTMRLAERPCPSCDESMYFDEDSSTYFSYVLGQGPFELAPEVVAFLAAKLDYRIGTIDAKLKVDKLIDGRITYLRLAGDLNNSFPREKLAEGLEGTAVVDLTGVPRVEPAGAAEWRSFVQQVTPVVDNMYLIGVAAPLVEKLCGTDDLGTKTYVVDFALPYICKTCGTTSAQMIGVAEHRNVLEFATAPELHCQTCKSALQCTAGEALMTILPGLPKPPMTKELGGKLAELRLRKIEKRTRSGIVNVPKVIADQPPRLGIATQILIALVVVAVAGVGVLVYQRLTRDKIVRGPSDLGPVVASSAPQRPAWLLAADPPGLAATRSGAAIGGSQPLTSLTDAEDEASDAAYEVVAGQVLVDEPAAWVARVAPQILDVGAAAKSAQSRDPLSTQARRDVHDGRHAVARVGKRASPPIAGRYWEAFDTVEGRRFVAFAQIEVSRADHDRMVEAARKESTALGATVVDYLPMLGWRYPKVDHGAVVEKLEHGVLQDLGLAEHYIVLAIDGHDVADAASFAKLVTDEYASFAEHGGPLRLRVQTDTGDPREFSKMIAGKQAATPPPPPVTPHGPTPTTGGVNVWDRFGGNRGSGTP